MLRSTDRSKSFNPTFFSVLLYRLDGGRIVQALYGRIIAGRVSGISLLLQGLGAILSNSPLLLFWGLIAVFFQSRSDIPCQVSAILVTILGYAARAGSPSDMPSVHVIDRGGNVKGQRSQSFMPLVLKEDPFPTLVGQDEITEPDNTRSIIGLAALVLMVLVLSPYPDLQQSIGKPM